ncbi:Microcystin-dependent protein [Candidatus Electrothrix aarhusensis]|uniref:Microcystin-dependent protein n=1 Tax=Candidatus Electrothrix aarhusensis TaxID=1859131 RepID=A0A444IVG7_9BACT|nr:Microcystin-dependent protein [Candidatus Electrothrix aarhusensis]
MSESFIGEIRMVAFNFAPRGWAFCDGQILPISQNQTLHEELQDIYGEDGQGGFALPDLRGRTPVHAGDGPGLPVVKLGEKGGSETVALKGKHLPIHTHTLYATTSQGGNRSAENDMLALTDSSSPYGDGVDLVDMKEGSIGEVGGNAHNNMQPYTTVNFCIALQGLMPDLIK